MIFLVFKVAVSVQTVHPIYFILNTRSISLEKNRFEGGIIADRQT